MYDLRARIPVSVRETATAGSRFALLLIFLLLLSGLAAGSAWAIAGAWAENEHTRLRLISETEGLKGEEVLNGGLQFELAEGWKTYWRSPGDAGYPLTIDWSASENLAEAELEWPVPHRFILFGLDTFGYEQEVVFPLRLRPEDPERALHLVAEVDYLLCEQVCIPYVEEVSLTLPPDIAGPAPEAFLIDLYRSQVPGSEEASGLSLERVGLLGANDGLRLEAQAHSLFPFGDQPDLLIEGPNGLHFGRPEVRLSDEGRQADFSIPIATRNGTAAEGSEVRLTLVDGTRGLESTVRLDRLAGPTPGQATGQITEKATGQTGGQAAEHSLLLVLSLALLGGVILNLMPCVLPVLSLKLMSLISHGNSTPAAVRISFLATAAGILFSFLVLAGGTIALKTAGAAVGWGIQFQQPVFLAAMALVVTLFAGNLFGFFEILLPSGLAEQTTRTTGKGLAGAFATGAFATLLATPCSAPFLGTAVGFALSRGAAEILLIFTALGIGLALPYLAVAVWPRLARALPRPGPWMIWLRLLLGLALLGTALWLLSVLAVQVSLAAAIILGGLLALLLALLAFRRFGSPHRVAFRSLASLTVVAIFAVAALAAPNQDTNRAQESRWQTFDRERIAEAVAAGQTVLVDVTADWCITCQVNKARVLESEAVEALLQDDSLLALRADWTRPNADIADYLAAHGRYGIPFNAVYGPAEPEGILLPELLSVDALRSAVEEAAGQPGLGTKSAP